MSDATIKIEHIRSAQNDAGRAHECDPAPRLIDADKRQQFAHEIAGARKTYRRHGTEQEKHGITRHIDRKTAITADLTGVQSIINYANTQEKSAGDKAVSSEEHTSELQSLMRT